MGTNDDDFVEHLLTTSTHDHILFFTNKGKVYRTKGYEIPEYSRTAKGIPIINLLGVDKGEWINAIIQFVNLVTMNSYSSQQNKVSLREHHFHHLRIYVQMV